MRLLLLLALFVACTQAFTVFFNNNCTNEITVNRWNTGNIQGVITLPPKQNGTDTILVNENIEYDVVRWYSTATFTAAAGQRTNFTLNGYAFNNVNPITVLKPACPSGQPCPAFRCGLNAYAACCKKDGDAEFSIKLFGSRPNTMNYNIMYCASP